LGAMPGLELSAPSNCLHCWLGFHRMAWFGIHFPHL